MHVRLTKAQRIKILNADDLFAVMRQILLRENKIRREQEHFWVVGLANNNKILYHRARESGQYNGRNGRTGYPLKAGQFIVSVTYPNLAC